MEYQSLNESARMVANNKKRSLYINKVESGLPRWLIEVGFVCFVIQALNSGYDIAKWGNANGLQMPVWAIVLAGDMILYYAMMRGMKPLVRPFTVLWWIFMVVVVAGDITAMFPESVVDLALAVATPLVFLPLGFMITYFLSRQVAMGGHPDDSTHGDHDYIPHYALRPDSLHHRRYNRYCICYSPWLDYAQSINLILLLPLRSEYAGGIERE